MSTSITTAVNTVSFAETALTYNINKLNRETLLPGITKGGLLTRIADNQVSIAPFTALFQMDYGTSPVHKLLVKSYNASSVSVNVTASQPYVVMSMSWVREEDNYPIADIKSLAELATLDSSYIIVGKVPFTGSIIDSPATFDYTNTTRGFLYNSNPSSRSKLISRVGIEPGTSITEEQDVINLKYLNDNTDLGIKPSTQIPFGQGTNFFAYSSDFIWNNSTKRLTLNGNINLSSPTSTSDVGNVAYMDARYFAGSEQSTPNLSDKMPLYDGAYKYITLDTVRKPYTHSSVTDVTIQDTDTYTDYLIPHTTANGFVLRNLPTLSANINKRYKFKNTGNGITKIVSEEGSNIIFQNNFLSDVSILMMGDFVEILGTSSGWFVEHANINMITNWINTNEWRTRRFGSAFTYDNKSNSGVSWTGQHITEATSNQKTIVLYDEQLSGTTGKLHVYNITDSSTGLGFWTNNRVITAGADGATMDVNETTGTSKIINNYIRVDPSIAGLIEPEMTVNTTASFTNSNKVGFYSAQTSNDICSGFIDSSNLFIASGNGGFTVIDYASGNRVFTTGDYFYNLCWKINF